MTAATIDPNEFEDDPRLAEVVAIYARTVIDVRHCAQGAYTIGDARRASFPLLSTILPDPHNFPLVCWTDRSIALRFTADMRGELVEGARRSSLDELIASGRATPVDGAFTVELAPGARGVVALEAVRFELRSVSAPDRTRVVDRSWWAHVAVVYLVLYTLLALVLLRPHFAGTFAAAHRPPTGDRSERDLATSPAALIRHGRLALAQRTASRTLARVFALVPGERPAPGRSFAAHTAWSDAAARDIWGLRDPEPADADELIELTGADWRDRPRRSVRSRDPDQIQPLGPADVRRILTSRGAALRRCGSLGAASVHFTINGAGLVTAVVIAAGHPREARAAQCVANELRRTWFPRGVGSLRASYPLPPTDRAIARAG